VTTEELLQAGIEAVRTGDLDRAASLFADVVKNDPSSDRGWYLLGMCVSSRERRAFCLRRALAINPNNAPARKQLDLLSPPPASTPSPRADAGEAMSPAPVASAPSAPPLEPPPAPSAPADAGDMSSSLPFTPPPWAKPAPWEHPSLAEETHPEPEQPQAAEIETPTADQPPFRAPETGEPQPQAGFQPPFSDSDNAELRALYSEPEPAGEEPPTFAYDDSPLKAFLAGLETAAPQPSAAVEDSHPRISVSESEPKPAAAPQPAPKAAPQPSPERLPAPAGRKPPVKKKKSNHAGTIALVVVSLLLLGLCALGIGYLVLSGRIAGLLTPASIQIPTALVMPTSAPTQPAASEVPSANAAAPSSAPAVSTPLPTSLPMPTSLPTVTYTPTFESASCRFDVPKGAHVTCGYLIVPEDRAGDPTHTIRLAVAVYHSDSSQPAPEPVLFLQGGPGGQAVKLSAQAYSILVAPFLPQRDFIAYDQRGTGLSEPALNCNDLTKAYLQDIYGQILPDTRKIVYSNAFLSCQGQMSVGGTNLNAYTTSASAADVRDLLQVLNYPQVDLYGASYGTRLAQVILRDDPALVHAAMLDSVVPIETNFFAQYPESIQSALKQLFASCAADPGCSAAYPDLEAVFWDQVNRLDAKPVPLTIANPKTGTISESVDGSVFINLVLGSLKQSDLIATAPQTIYRFKAGDYSAVLAAETSLPFAFEGISAGLYISMMCHEHILATTPDQLQAAMGGPADIQEYAWLPFFGNAQDVYRACQSWHAVGPRLGENAPVSSDIPTLIITGKYDPTTPPKYAQQVAAHLSHSYYFEFPNQGHTPTAADVSGCAMKTAVAFLADPQVEPDRSCLNNLRPVAFIMPYTGNPPVELKNTQASGISVRMPRGWSDLGDGFYLRGDSPFDITEIGVMPVPGTTSAALLKWISQKAWGFRGLDAAPVWAGQRTANGLKWTLYTASSYGRPADIAMADHNGSSILVLAFSNIDEHDAFYRTIFLPVLDSVQP
jgi:pimeloyl-ACP methyl ester carboxylesterase